MDPLRLILLVVGVMVIVLIYAWGMRSRIKAKLKDRRRAARLPEHEPVLNEPGALPSYQSLDQSLGDIGKMSAEQDPFVHQRLVDVEIRRIERPAPAPKPAARPTLEPGGKTHDRQARSESSQEPQKVVLLTIMAPPGQPFKGCNILKVTQELDLGLGEGRIFECIADGEPDKKGKAVFSIANILEPGTFDLDTMDTLSTPGLLMFMRLPGPVESVMSVELMITVARQLAHRLGGTVCDERRNKLTNQAIMHLHSEVSEFERRRRVWAHQHHG